MRCLIHSNGGFDIFGEHINLTDNYPSIDGQPLRPVRVRVEGDSIAYYLKSGTVIIRLTRENDRIAVSACLEGLPGVHDFEPLGNARIAGADRVFIQGFGMEGPSGTFAVTDSMPVSHGLIALYRQENVLLAYAEDHTRYNLCFRVGSCGQLFQDFAAFSGGFNLEKTGGESVSFPTLYLEEQTGLEAGLRHCAERIAKTMGARRRKPPAFFWNSWYYLYQTINQSLLDEYLKGMKSCPEAAFQYIEIDAGYAPHPGDWLQTGYNFPGGLKQAAQSVLDAGFQPGIWVAPFIVGDQSALCQKHPDWLLKNPDGSPTIQLRSYTEPKIWGIRDSNYYILDASHPDALDYLYHIFHTLKQWGFSMFKTDFMLWKMRDTSTVRRYNPGLTSVEILRNVLATVRNAIGEESYLLGCIAPFLPFVGYADGMRLAGDMGAQWKEPFGPVNLLREMPCCAYFNHIYWQNDPDAVLLREFDTFLNPVEARSLALLQALSGGVISTSDPVHRLGEDRRRLLNFIRPGKPVAPEFPYLGSLRKDRPELVLLHRLPQGNLLFALNPTDTPLTVCYSLKELFGNKNWYQYRYLWDAGGECVSTRENLFVGALAPHDSLLLFVTEQPIKEKPANLWNW